MSKITQSVLEQVETFRKPNGYILSQENPIYCPQVNGLTNICLSEFGLFYVAKKNAQDFFNSPSFNPMRGLFHREVGSDGEIVEPSFNSCKNSVFSLGLASSMVMNEAREIMRRLEDSPAYIKDEGLFGREYNPESGELNPLLITQSNLWAALAYSSIGEDCKTSEIMHNLKGVRYDSKMGLFNSQDCRCGNYFSRFFADDQALAALTYSKIGESGKAQRLMKSVLESKFYDKDSGLFNSSLSNSDIDETKSTYKNSLMALALGKLTYEKKLGRVQDGLVRELYDPSENLFCQTTKDQTKVPDNSALALVALEYDNIEHLVF